MALRRNSKFLRSLFFFDSPCTFYNIYSTYREVGAVLTRRLYNIYKYDFELFGYKADKYLSRD